MFCFECEQDTHHRKVMLFDQYPLAYIKAIKNKADASINEILHAALGKAIRDFCLHNDCPVIRKHGEKTRCRAGMTFGFPRDPDADINDACHNGWCVRRLKFRVHLRFVVSHFDDRRFRIAPGCCWRWTWAWDSKAAGTAWRTSRRGVGGCGKRPWYVSTAGRPPPLDVAERHAAPDAPPPRPPASSRCRTSSCRGSRSP